MNTLSANLKIVKDELLKLTPVNSSLLLEVVRLIQVKREFGTNSNISEIYSVINDQVFCKKYGFHNFSTLSPETASKVFSELSSLTDDEELSLVLALYENDIDYSPVFTIDRNFTELLLENINIGKTCIIGKSDALIPFCVRLAKKYKSCKFTFLFDPLEDYKPLHSMIFSRLNNVTLKYSDILETPDLGFNFETFIHLPVFGSRVASTSGNGELLKINSDEVVLTEYSKLLPNTDTYILLPERPLFTSGNAAQARSKINTNSRLNSIISFPPGILGHRIGIKANLINLKKTSSKTDVLAKIYKYEVGQSSKRGDKPYLSEDFKISRNLISEVNSWAPVRYLENNDDSFKIKGDTVSLEEISVEIFRGAPLVKAKELPEGTPGSSTLKIVEHSHIEDHIDLLMIPKKAASSVRNLKRYELRPGDIIITARGASIKVGVVDSDDFTQAYPSNNLAVIRIDGKKANPLYVAEFLRSPVGMKALELIQIGTALKAISVKDLGGVQVPALPLERQLKIMSKFQAEKKKHEQAIKSATEKITTAKQSLFEEMGLTI